MSDLVGNQKVGVSRLISHWLSRDDQTEDNKVDEINKLELGVNLKTCYGTTCQGCKLFPDGSFILTA